ncbi:MAG: tetratricopeptide repeat protein [Burkholderiales bacterium]|nr:tetratricopeptide repeat protein [Anaerolineae bacterium]
MMRQRWAYIIAALAGLIAFWAVPALLAQDAEDFFDGIQPYSVPAPIAADTNTPEEAIAILTFAIRFAHPYENLTITYSDRAVAYTRAGDYEAALDDWERSLYFSPDYVRALVEMGCLYFRLEAYDLALENLNHALELDSDSVEAYANRGLVYARLGQYEAAVEDFTAAIERNPDLLNIFYLRGAAFFWLGDSRSAIDDQRQAIELNPDFSLSYSIVGFELPQVDPSEVEEGMCEPDYSIPQLTIRAQQSTEAGDFDAVVDTLTCILVRQPNHPTAQIDRGKVYYNMGLLEEALADYNAGIELNDNNLDWRAYEDRATIYRDMGELELALEDANQAVERATGSGQYIFDIGPYWLRARIYGDMRNYEQAITDFTVAIDNAFPEDNLAAIYGDRALTYINQLDYESALADWQRVLELDPTLITHRRTQRLPQLTPVPLKMLFGICKIGLA